MRAPRGFTLIEVLIAMAITAFVSVLSYQALSTALTGIESVRAESERLHEINRAFNVLSRDIRQMTNRPVRDEFGQLASAVLGGAAGARSASFDARRLAQQYRCSAQYLAAGSLSPGRRSLVEAELPCS
ncbi:type II secretion system minor pseudopilin GspJ [Luminiphilus sp.]|nr:type II secretion system minor pseudopilin GspJ [Luminiphilus sp.]